MTGTHLEKYGLSCSRDCQNKNSFPLLTRVRNSLLPVRPFDRRNIGRKPHRCHHDQLRRPVEIRNPAHRPQRDPFGNFLSTEEHCDLPRRNRCSQAPHLDPGNNSQEVEQVCPVQASRAGRNFTVALACPRLCIPAQEATVYAWEAGKSKPRATQLAAIARVRKLGKRSAAELLATLS